MDEVSIQEFQKYEKIWTSFSDYRKPGPAHDLTPFFLSYFADRLEKGDSLLDLGCGTGASTPLLLEAGLKVGLVDICESCLDPEIFLLAFSPNRSIQFFQESLWELSSQIQPADWIICFDVLEHLPEDKIDAVLSGFASRMKKGGVFSISLNEDVCGQFIGEKLHLTVKSAGWWRAKILSCFNIEKEYELDLGSYIAICSSKLHGDGAILDVDEMALVVGQVGRCNKHLA